MNEILQHPELNVSSGRGHDSAGQGTVQQAADPSRRRRATLAQRPPLPPNHLSLQYVETLGRVREASILSNDQDWLASPENQSDRDMSMLLAPAQHDRADMQDPVSGRRHDFASQSTKQQDADLARRRRATLARRPPLPLNHPSLQHVETL